MTLKEALAQAGITPAQLSSLEASGYCIVPTEATDAMIVNGAAAIRDFYSEKGNYPRTKAMWRNMLAARPKLDDK